MDGTETSREGQLALRLGNLRRVSAMLLAAESPSAVARVSLEVLAERVDVVRGSVSELDHERDETVVLAVVGEASADVPAGTRLRMADPDVLRRYRRGSRIEMPDLAALEEPTGVDRKLLEMGVRSYVNVPLLADGELVGSLNLGSSRPHGFHHDHIELAEDLAGLVAIAIREARLREQLLHRSRELEASIAELERIDAWRRRLVNMLAHDVRSPLSTVVTTMQIISGRISELRQDQLRHLVDSAERSARRTIGLAEDLLALARSEEGRLVLHRTRLDVAAAVRSAFSNLHSSHTPVIDVPAGLEADVDPRRFGQIVTNLIENAYRHGEPPVTVAARPRSGGGIRLTVTDVGGGVPQQQVPSLFRPFAEGSRADSVGLGLWVVSELAAAHGGEVRYTDPEGPGACFVVDLPPPEG
ncbi:MAG: GAF domain-containing protein [Actinobacteria bacterium]|nr:GAF domain-containing protein [Actinomycetota bacterium]